MVNFSKFAVINAVKHTEESEKTDPLKKQPSITFDMNGAISGSQVIGMIKSSRSGRSSDFKARNKTPHPSIPSIGHNSVTHPKKIIDANL